MNMMIEQLMKTIDQNSTNKKYFIYINNLFSREISRNENRFYKDSDAKWQHDLYFGDEQKSKSRQTIPKRDQNHFQFVLFSKHFSFILITNLLDIIIITIENHFIPTIIYLDLQKDMIINIIIDKVLMKVIINHRIISILKITIIVHYHMIVILITEIQLLMIKFRQHLVNNDVIMIHIESMNEHFIVKEILQIVNFNNKIMFQKLTKILIEII